MKFYFKIHYKPCVRWWFGKHVSFKIIAVGIVCENGKEFYEGGKSLSAIRFRLATFLRECFDVAELTGVERVQFIGHYCATEHLLLEQIWPWRTNNEPTVIDIVDDLNELAADLPDECFSLDSEYSLVKDKLPAAVYRLFEKVEMILSHPDLPDIDKSQALRYAQWISQVYNFKLLQIHLIGRGLPIILTEGHENDNN